MNEPLRPDEIAREEVLRLIYQRCQLYAPLKKQPRYSVQLKVLQGLQSEFFAIMSPQAQMLMLECCGRLQTNCSLEEVKKEYEALKKAEEQ